MTRDELKLSTSPVINLIQWPALNWNESLLSRDIRVVLFKLSSLNFSTRLSIPSYRITFLHNTISKLSATASPINCRFVRPRGSTVRDHVFHQNGTRNVISFEFDRQILEEEKKKKKIRLYEYALRNEHVNPTYEGKYPSSEICKV